MFATHATSTQRSRGATWGMLVLASWLAGCSTTAPVSPSSPALDASSPRPSPVAQTIALGRLAVQYGVAGDIALMVESRSGVVGFGDGVPGLSYGSTGQGPYGEVEDARGVVIADITGAAFHANGEPSVGENAADVLANMDALRLTDGSRAYEVGPITKTEIAGTPALAADVSAKYSYPFLEMGEASHVVYLGMPQRLIVADVAGAIALVQIWASTADGLDRWLPSATAALTNSMRLVQCRSPSACAAG